MFQYHVIAGDATILFCTSGVLTTVITVDPFNPDAILKTDARE